MGLAAAISVAAPGSEQATGEANAAANPSPASEQPGSSSKKSAKPTAERAKAASNRTSQSKPSRTTTATKSSATATVRAPKKTAPPTKPCNTDLAGTLAPVAQVGNHVKEKFDIDEVGGRASRAGASDHPSGLALDFMVDPSTGDQVAEYVLDNQEDFGVTYVIWQQRYNDGSGWSMMEDRGSPTANHMDHVHVSFSGEDVDVDC